MRSASHLTCTALHNLGGGGGAVCTDCVTVMFKHSWCQQCLRLGVFYRMTHSLMDRQIDILTLSTRFPLTGGETVMEEDCK